MERTNNTGGVFLLRQKLWPIEERYMEQNYSQHIKEGAGGITNGRATAVWSQQVVERFVRNAM